MSCGWKLQAINSPAPNCCCIRLSIIAVLPLSHRQSLHGMSASARFQLAAHRGVLSQCAPSHTIAPVNTSRACKFTAAADKLGQRARIDPGSLWVPPTDRLNRHPGPRLPAAHERPTSGAADARAPTAAHRGPPADRTGFASPPRRHAPGRGQTSIGSASAPRRPSKVPRAVEIEKWR